MKKNVRDSLNNFSQGLGHALKNFSSSFSSICRMFVLSKISVSRQSKNYPKLKENSDCTILANGPSLKEALDNNEVLLEEKDVFVVNMFVQSPEFWTVKPMFYFLADNAFFSPQSERAKQYVSILTEEFNKIDWEMYLCVPSGCVSGGILKNISNPNIKVIHWNTTTFEGFRGLCHFMFRHNLAMPRCQTVTNMALAASINMGYKNVYLYGADHSWTKDLRVDDDNVVCYGDRHVYATGLQVIKKDCTIGALLHAFGNMFDTHQIIEEYAQTMNVSIWNCTKGSFVDAYKRKK